MKPERIALARELLGVTQRELAQVLGVHTQTLSKWERGTLKPPRLQHEIIEGLLHQQTKESEPRLVGHTIRLHLSMGELLKAHVALVVYAYR